MTDDKLCKSLLKLSWMRFIFVIMILVFSIFLENAEGARRRRKRYHGPPPTHPVVLWARTLSNSGDIEQQRIAAFKLSQYSQTIFQDNIIEALILHMKDPDNQIRVFCTLALKKAGTQGDAEKIRKALLEGYQQDPFLRDTIVRVFTFRKDSTPAVHNTFLQALNTATENEAALALLGYFEENGSGDNSFVEILTNLYARIPNSKLRRAVVKTLADRAHGQEEVINLFRKCMEEKDTPLLLACLEGFKSQGHKDPNVWTAVEKISETEDPDVLLATLDVINVLPPTPNLKITKRLIQLIGETDDVELLEKAVLAMGVAGDQNPEIIDKLQALFDSPHTDETIKIAVALVSGKQALKTPEKARAMLKNCALNSKSQNLRSACQLGLKDLDSSNTQPSRTLSTP